MNRRYVIPVILLLACSLLSGTDSSPLDLWKAFSRSPECRKLTAWLRLNAESILLKKNTGAGLPVSVPGLSGRAGMFITLIKKGKVRGCYGAFHHESGDTAEIFLDYLEGALFRDPRYRPLEPSELADTEIVVTITSYPEPADDINNIDISSCGVFIECDGTSGMVIVPAEFRTISRITALGGKSDCRYSRFRAVTIR